MASDGHPPEPERKDDVAPAAVGPGISIGYPYNQRFTCCVCLELLYKPLVISCGHMLCFWCVHSTMDMYKESLCAVCRQPYKHFPRICELMHHLLLKLEPAEYKRREKDMLEEEKRTRMYSPQIIEFLNSKNNDLGNNGENRNEDSKTRAPQEVSLNGSIVDKHSKKIKLEDVSCPLCKEMLYQPAGLNCGHVYCVSCLPSLNEEALKCHVCGSLHPGKFPNICRDLDHFLEEYFPAEYESRVQKVQSKKGHCYREGSSSGKSAEGRNRTQHDEDKLNDHVGVGCDSEGSNQAQQDEDPLDVNIGVVCDSCGVCPIPGNQYRCKDCRGSPFFNLCEACYSSGSNFAGRFNQKHTADHRMELTKAAHYRTLLAEVMNLELEIASAHAANAQIVIDNQGMEDGNDEGLGEAEVEEPVAPGAMHVVMDDQETEDNGEDQELYTNS